MGGVRERGRIRTWLGLLLAALLVLPANVLSSRPMFSGIDTAPSSTSHRHPGHQCKPSLAISASDDQLAAVEENDESDEELELDCPLALHALLWDALPETVLGTGLHEGPPEDPSGGRSHLQRSSRLRI